MELKEVLAAIPGLHRQFVYYLESQGYIHPEKIRHARIARRDYRNEDLRVLSEMWRYYQRGYSVQAAYQLLNREQRLTTYVTLPVPERSWQAAIQAVREQPSVLEASIVYGTTFDLVLRTDTPDEGEVYYGLLPALAAGGLTGAPTVLKTAASFHRPVAAQAASRMIAYVFMRVPNKDVEEVMRTLQEIDEVTEAATVYGETDIIAKVVAADQAALDALVMERLHRLEKVESTRTFIVIGGLHWDRSQGS